MYSKRDWFYDTEEELAEIISQRKLIPCPHCRQVGMLNLHGFIYGQTSGDKKIVRGRRIYCNKRGRRRGCGKTFALLASTTLKRFTIGTAHLLAFLKCLGSHCSRIAAFRKSCVPLEESAVYYLLRLIKRSRHRVHGFLLRICSPPVLPEVTDPSVQTLAHLCKTFPNAPNPIATFQHKFQACFL